MGFISSFLGEIVSETGCNSYKCYEKNRDSVVYIEKIEREGFSGYELGEAIIKSFKEKKENAVIEFYDRSGMPCTLGGERNPKREDFNIDLPKSWLPYTNGINNLSQLKLYNHNGLSAFLIIDNENIKKFINNCRLSPRFDLFEAFNNNDVVSSIFETISQLCVNYFSSSNSDYDDTYYKSKYKVIKFDKNGISVEDSIRANKPLPFDELGLNNLPNDDYLVAFVCSTIDRMTSVGICGSSGVLKLSEVLETINVYKKELYMDKNTIIKPVCYNGYTYGLKSIHKIFDKVEVFPFVFKTDNDETCIFVFLNYGDIYFNYEKNLPHKQDWF